MASHGSQRAGSEAMVEAVSSEHICSHDKLLAP